jgi:hypothetical protein
MFPVRTSWTDRGDREAEDSMLILTTEGAEMSAKVERHCARRNQLGSWPPKSAAFDEKTAVRPLSCRCHRTGGCDARLQVHRQLEVLAVDEIAMR